MKQNIKQKTKAVEVDNLSALLSQKGLVYSALSSVELSARIEKCRSEKRPLRILYGETFDELGNTMDSMKYYFFTSLLAKEIKRRYDVEVEPVVLIADLGVYRNSPDQLEELKRHAQNRADFANRVRETYNCAYEVRLLSDVASTQEFKDKFNKAVEIGKADEALMTMINETVPEDRREASKKNGYIYSFEEISVILGIDIKIGPPREKLYDNTANAMLEHFKVDPLLPVYLMPTYPLGTDYASYINSPINQYGLTPYKAGSGHMTKNRIVVGQTSSSSIEHLIDGTEISPEGSRPNPVLDIAFIADMARQHLQGVMDQSYASSMADKYASSNMESDDLKAKTIIALQKYVLSILPDTRNLPDDVSEVGDSDIDPWGNKAMMKFRSTSSVSVFPIADDIKEFFNGKTMLFERGLIVGHTGFERVAEKIRVKEDFLIVSGFSASGDFHYGHKAVVDTYKFFRQFTTKGYFVVCDVDAYVSRSDKDIPSPETAQRYAIGNIADALAMGVPKEDIKIQSKQVRGYYNLTFELSKKLPFNLMKAVLGHNDLGKFTAVYLQIADILYPQLETGTALTLIPVGLDQRPILRLANEAVEKFSSIYNFTQPAVVYTAHVPSLADYRDKMSKSKQGSALLLNSTNVELDILVAAAVTGGRDTKAEQEKYGGMPNSCPVYKLYVFNHQDPEFVKGILGQCASGKLLCGADKKMLKDFLRPSLEEHHAKRVEYLEIARDMMRR